MGEGIDRVKRTFSARCGAAGLALLLSCFFPLALSAAMQHRRCARLMRIDGPRALNFLRSVAHSFYAYIPRSSPVRLASVHPVRIECRFQTLTDFASVTAQGCEASG